MGRVVRLGYYATTVALAVPALALAGVVIVGNWLEESIRDRSESRALARTEAAADDYEIDLREGRPVGDQAVYLRP